MQKQYTYVCPQCHRSFITTNKPQRFCSISCGGKARKRGSHLYHYVCANCGKQFQSPYRSGKFCTKSCYQSYTSNPVGFWARVDKSGGPDACWPWMNCRHPKGYGQLTWKGHGHRAHCVAYELTHGSIPDGLQVLHACDNPPCCNPRHLFAGTNADNVADKIAKGRARYLSGEELPQSKLTWEKVHLIRSLANGGMGSTEIAKRLDINRCTANNVIHNRAWRE